MASCFRVPAGPLSLAFPASSEPPSSPAGRLAALVDRLRPEVAADHRSAERRLRREIAWLQTHPQEAATLGEDLHGLLVRPGQAGFYAETGVRSALGFLLELAQRLSHAVLPPARAVENLRDAFAVVFRHPDDHEWVGKLDAGLWQELIGALNPSGTTWSEASLAPAWLNVVAALRLVSYRLAGAALDRELLRADPALEREGSPFLTQNAALLPLLDLAGQSGDLPDASAILPICGHLDHCAVALVWARQNAQDRGVSIRLTYLLARLDQLVERERQLLECLAAPEPRAAALRLLRVLLDASQRQSRLGAYIADNISLVARNVTDHASHHGEHYIAETRSDWWAMARGAAGGGLVIAFMALAKIKLAALSLPPLTEGIAFGLNYSLGFVLIHLLGFTVATKQPAMTAATIAATLEEAHPRQLAKLADLCQNVVRTQFVAVLGNVVAALPLACLLAWAWPLLTGQDVSGAEKAQHLLGELQPHTSGALFFAAVAGLGLFLSGLVSGFFDNRARYHDLTARIASAPLLAWLGKIRRARLGDYLDRHYGAILGNLFFGMYLGLVGVTSELTGLPLDIRHVAFSSANLGTAVTTLGWHGAMGLLPWAVVGVAGVALVNLAVSFSLALYVALKSRRQGMRAAFSLGQLLWRRFVAAPLSFFRPPAGRL